MPNDLTSEVLNIRNFLFSIASISGLLSKMNRKGWDGGRQFMSFSIKSMSDLISSIA